MSALKCASFSFKNTLAIDIFFVPADFVGEPLAISTNLRNQALELVSSYQVSFCCISNLATTSTKSFSCHNRIAPKCGRHHNSLTTANHLLQLLVYQPATISSSPPKATRGTIESIQTVRHPQLLKHPKEAIRVRKWQWTLRTHDQTSQQPRVPQIRMHRTRQ